MIIARFCQKVKDTLNQDRISPSNHASKRSPAVVRTRTTKTAERVVEVFIGQTASAAEGISTTSGSLLSSN
jgi:S1-C subfamily serine protease